MTEKKVELATVITSTNLEIISISQLMKKFLINKNQTKFDTFIPSR